MFCRYTERTEQEITCSPRKSKEELIMGLKHLFGWGSKAEVKAASACGSACGAGNKPAEPSSACGAAAPKPTACGSACGAGDKQ